MAKTHVSKRPMAEDMQSIIFAELQKVDGPQKTTADRVMVCCPFHDERTPSCGIVVSEGSRYPMGTFNCFGCPESGDWNKFAKQAGLRQISGLIPKTGGADTAALSKKIREMEGSMLTEKNTDMNAMISSLGETSFIDWPIYNEWRGYPGWLIRNLNGLAAVNKYSEFKCLLPVKVGKEIKGVIEALEEKKEGKLSYISSSGDWVKESGLFPFNFVREMLRYMKFRYVILVEGPRDAMRLIMAGIPALAVLGSQNINGKKIRLLERLEIELLCWLPDNDKAGKAMAEKMEWLCDKMDVDFKTRGFRLPRKKNKMGEIEKLDPDGMPDNIMKNLKGALKEYGATFLKEQRIRLIEQK